LSLLYSLVDDRTVLVTHSPAYGILDLGILGLPAGSLSIKELVEERNPLLHIHGHIHEEFGVRGRHFNVAAAGHKRAFLIDTDTMEHQVLGEGLA
jgi:Icc-related predicted phosphoesterase